jgi:hypothetical protein
VTSEGTGQLILSKYDTRLGKEKTIAHFIFRQKQESYKYLVMGLTLSAMLTLMMLYQVPSFHSFLRFYLFLITGIIAVAEADNNLVTGQIFNIAEYHKYVFLVIYHLSLSRSKDCMLICTLLGINQLHRRK